MKIRMGYTHPDAVNAKRKALAAKRQENKRRVDERVAAGLASLVEAAVSKVKNPEPEAPSESTTKTPAPFGQNRPWRVKDFVYYVFNPEDQAKAHVRKVVSLATGDRAPALHLDSFWQCKDVYGEILRDVYAVAGVSPVSFSVFRLDEDRTHVGYGRFTADFIADDPKYLSRDLAHVGARLAARGLYFEFNYADDCGVAIDGKDFVFTPSASESKVPATDFAGAMTLVSWHEETGLYSYTMLRPGDRVAPDFDGYFAQQRDTFAKILDSYRETDARKRGGALDAKAPSAWFDGLKASSKARPHQFVLYDAFRKNAETEFFASVLKPDGGFRVFTASKSDSGHGRAYHGAGWLPESFGPDELAHLACRFAAHGLIFGLVPDETDGVSPDVHALMWNAAA